MSYVGSGQNNFARSRFYKKMWFKITLAIVIILAISGGVLFWKAGSVIRKMTGGGIVQSLIHNIPGVPDRLVGEDEGRVNILLLGMRGENMSGGGNLADTIILTSIDTKAKKVAMISIPRDLYVTVPGTEDRQKINYVHFYGEQNGGQGLRAMEKIVSEVTGLPISYAIRINFIGFKQLVNAIGGVDITLDKSFEEPVQFDEPHVCNSFFNLPTGKYENKTTRYFSKTDHVFKTRIVASYPLCTAPKDTLECGGSFKLPAGKQTLNGEQALCYVRSRATTNDFERAKRQQIVIQLIKNKMLSAGTLTDFSKINAILDSLGENVRTDMKLWELQHLYELYKQMPDAQIYQRVLEDSEEGLLYYPGESAAGYILLPRGDNYDRIQNMAKDIFNQQAQSDIKPR